MCLFGCVWVFVDLRVSLFACWCVLRCDGWRPCLIVCFLCVRVFICVCLCVWLHAVAVLCCLLNVCGCAVCAFVRACVCVCVNGVVCLRVYLLLFAQLLNC